MPRRAISYQTSGRQFSRSRKKAGWDQGAHHSYIPEFFRERGGGGGGGGGGGRQAPVVLQPQPPQLQPKKLQPKLSGLQVPKQRCQTQLQRQQESQQNKEPTINKEIDAVGTVYKNPFTRLQFPQHFVKPDINQRIYDSFKLQNTPENFEAGKTKNFKDNWFKITYDKFIRNTIGGYKDEMDDIPIQTVIPKPIQFSSEEHDKISKEIERFLECKIIEEVNEATDGEYISNIFFRPKKDGKIRIILNLKSLNKNYRYLDKIHFKMETLQSAIHAMRKNCFFGSVDLSEAFYSIPIRQADRKFFRFIHKGQKYQFTALIMGLTHSPRVFTKILKPIFAKLRSKGHVSSAYIDDSCLQGASYHQCQQNIEETVRLMDSLGLTVQPQKSIFEPTQQIIFLGFLLCSVTITIRLPPERRVEIIRICSNILPKRRVTIRTFSQLIGKLLATQQGLEYAPLFYKPLEKVKEGELKKHGGNYNSFMTIPKKVHPVIN